MPLGLDPKKLPKYVLVPGTYGREESRRRTMKNWKPSPKDEAHKMEITQDIGIIAKRCCLHSTQRSIPGILLPEARHGLAAPKKMNADFFNR